MIDVKETLKSAEDKMKRASPNTSRRSWLAFRAGRANVAILDGVMVTAYGQTVPLNQVANLAVPTHSTSPSVPGTVSTERH
jgi:ribosome recycling factor